MRAEVLLQAGPSAADLVLVPGRNLITGEDEVASQLGTLTSLESDLLRVASGVFAVDLAVKRGERENITRDLELEVPVVNFQAFQRIQDELNFALYVLGPDNWLLRFTPAVGEPERVTEWPDRGGTTLLFSGGLDSGSAAVQLLEAGGAVTLVSHYTQNPAVRGSQDRIAAYLRDTFGDLDRVAARITGRNIAGNPFPADGEREFTQRTRSFMFLVLGAIVARRRGQHELVMLAENGPMAIHLAISTARMGLFSTHTAHPEYIQEMERILSAVLNFVVRVENPFLYATKGEVVAPLLPGHVAVVRESVSCWKAARHAIPHCGECIPCLVRRVSLERNGYHAQDYVRDLLAENIAALSESDEGKRNLVDLADFALAWSAGQPAEALRRRFPDIVNIAVDEAQAVGLYTRFGEEVLAVLASYPNVQAILS